jgi:arylsulfatase B
MRGKKGSPYDGGHRVPFFLRWPAGGIDHGADITALTGAVDLYPTLADFCGIPLPKGYRPDGISLKAMLRTGRMESASRRTLVTDSQRVSVPVKWKDSCVMDQGWRLINGRELYNVARDPAQENDLSNEHPEVAERLRAAYEKWWAEISPSFNKDARIVVGSPKADPVKLTAHDWISSEGDPPWNQSLIREAISSPGRTLRGTWALEIASNGLYRISLRRWPRESGAAISASLPPGSSSPGLQAYRETPGRAIAATSARIMISGQTFTAPVSKDAPEVTFEVRLSSGPADLQADFLTASKETVGAFYAEVERLER